MPKRPSGKHLTEADRAINAQLLKEGRSLRYIAGQIGCAPSTITREIKNHAERRTPRTCGCIHFMDCEKRNECHPAYNCTTSIMYLNHSYI